MGIDLDGNKIFDSSVSFLQEVIEEARIYPFFETPT